MSPAGVWRQRVTVRHARVQRGVEWYVGQRFAVLSGGTSPAETGSASPWASGSSSATSDSDVRTLRITVTGKRVTPAPARVDLASGERLRLVITVDHDDQVHVHGFEVEREVTAGEPLTIDLTGGEPGLYEVETHEPELRLLQVLVR